MHRLFKGGFSVSINFWNRFVCLCKESHTTPRAVAKKLEIPNYVLRNWQGGVWPDGIYLKKLSEFFDIPEENLLYTPEYRMRSTPPEAMVITTAEWDFIQAYRRNPHLQDAVDKLLDFHYDDESKTE